MALLSLAEMKAQVANGVGVMLPNGGVILDLADLPSEAELAQLEIKAAERAARAAGGDANLEKIAARLKEDADARQEQANAETRAQIAALTALLEKSQKPAVEPARPAPVVPVAPAKAPEKK